MKYAELRPTLLTGDLILSSGSSFFSKIIKEVVGCPYSHLSMVLWGIDIIDPEVWHDPDRLYCWEATGHGTGEVEWEKATYTPGVDFFSHLVNAKAGDVTIRRLSVPMENRPTMIGRFQLYRRDVIGRPYERDKLSMLKACYPGLTSLFGQASVQDLSSIFCWECVAAAYQAMGLLPADRPASSYPINDFCARGSLSLQGASLGEEIPVEL